MSGTTPDVSVLVACHDAERFIGQTLDSISAQTLPALETIVVDDGSSDASAEIVEGYASRGVRLLRQSRQGASVARNRALAASRGRFVIFVDADDVVAPTHLAALRARLDDDGRSVALSRWARFHRTVDEAVFPERPTERDLPGVEWLLLDWARREPMTQSGMILIPRRLIGETGGWDEQLTLSDDFEFFARVIARSDGVRFAPDARLYYRSGLPGSLSGRKGRAAAESAFASLTGGTAHLLAAEDTPRTRRCCANILKDFDYAYYPDHPDLRAAIRARVKALGGGDAPPSGPPGFQALRRLVGWRLARRAQRFAEQRGLNGAARRVARGNPQDRSQGRVPS